MQPDYDLMNAVSRRLLPALALIFFALPVRAQQIKSPYQFIDAKQEAGPFVAYVFPAKGDLGLGANDAAAFGARYGIRLSGTFAVQAEVMYFPTERAVLDSLVVNREFVQLSTASQDLVIATGALRFNITGPRTWHRLQPFLLAGGGVVTQVSTDQTEADKAPNEARLDFGTSFAGTIGAGIAWLPSSRLAIRLEGRNTLWNVDTPAALARADIGRVIPSDEWLQNFSVSAGVSILF